MAGILEFYGERAGVTVPDTARVGESVTIVVETFGGPVEAGPGEVVCIGPGSTEVARDGLVVEVKPVDVATRPAADFPCADMLVRLRHEATVTFTRSGTATVRVVGRRAPADEALVLTRRVVVLE
ncbi:MAG TPA: hypothetical protein VF263_08315 [Longimicrobiaceae bacterium]